MNLLKKIRVAARSFRIKEDGGMTVEFVIVLPFILWWFAGSFVYFDAFKSRNISLKAAYTLSDIVSRQTEASRAFLDSLNSLLDNMIHQSNDNWIRVSSIKYGEDETHSVLWSYATKGHEPLVDEMLLAERIPIMSINEEVLVTETFTPYAPAFNVGLSARTFEHFLISRPRFTSQLVVDFVSMEETATVVETDPDVDTGDCFAGNNGGGNGGGNSSGYTGGFCKNGTYHYRHGPWW